LHLQEDRPKFKKPLYMRDPDGTVIEFSEWDGTSRLRESS
jgi:hypothetical protein